MELVEICSAGGRPPLRCEPADGLREAGRSAGIFGSNFIEMIKEKGKQEKENTLLGNVFEETIVYAIVSGLCRGVAWVLGGIVSLFMGSD